MRDRHFSIRSGLDDLEHLAAPIGSRNKGVVNLEALTERTHVLIGGGVHE